MKSCAWRRIDVRYYLLRIWGDVEPAVLGPYRTEAMRDKKARRLRQDDPEGRHGVFMLDIPSRGDPRARAYRAGFLQEPGDDL
jgi:hypothetical protein